jgi:hypothetical protein
VAYLLPDRRVLARFRLEKPGEPVLAGGEDVKVFDPARVTRSLARLHQLRLHRLEADPARMKELTRAFIGGVEVEYASGRAQRFLAGETVKADSPLMIEERMAGSGEFREAQFLALVHDHLVSGVLMGRPLDLESHLVFSTPEEPVTSLRGRCAGFTYELVRDERRNFTVKASSESFALARASLEGFFRFLSGGLLTSESLLLPAEVPAGHEVTPESDFSELDVVVDGKKSTVRIAWGKITPFDSDGSQYHFTTVSTRPGVVFRVPAKKIIPICRTKLTWQLKAEDAEYLPVPGRFVQ